MLIDLIDIISLPENFRLMFSYVNHVPDKNYLMLKVMKDFHDSDVNKMYKTTFVLSYCVWVCVIV